MSQAKPKFNPNQRLNIGFFKFIAGRSKGKVLILDESNFDEEKGMVTDDEGKSYFISNVKELTEEEKNQCFREEKLF